MGSLRVGNPAYADFTTNLAAGDGADSSGLDLGTLIRITHNLDGVPNLPRMEMGFKHAGTEIYQLDDEASKTQTAATTYRCYGQEAQDCSLGSATGFINQDHLTYTGM